MRSAAAAIAHALVAMLNAAVRAREQTLILRI